MVRISVELAGVGLTFGLSSENKHIVLQLLDDSPSKECGQIQEKDFLIAVDGYPTDGKGVNDVRAEIVGQYGTMVVLSFERERPGQDATRFEVSLRRNFKPNCQSFTPVMFYRVGKKTLFGSPVRSRWISLVDGRLRVFRNDPNADPSRQPNHVLQMATAEFFPTEGCRKGDEMGHHLIGIRTTDEDCKSVILGFHDAEEKAEWQEKLAEWIGRALLLQRSKSTNSISTPYLAQGQRKEGWEAEIEVEDDFHGLL